MSTKFERKRPEPDAILMWMSRRSLTLTSSVMILLAILLLWNSAQPAAAQQDPRLNLTAIAGLDGYCKDNDWLPLRVNIENEGGEDLEGFVEVVIGSGGTNRSVYSEFVTLPIGARKQVKILAFAEGFVSQVTVRFANQGSILDSNLVRVDCLREGDRLFGLLADGPSGYSFLNDLESNGHEAFMALLNPADFPERSEGLSSLDGLVVANIDTGQLNEAQVTAIKDWVLSGGQLIVMGGVGWQKTAAGLAELLPISPIGTNQLGSANALESFAISNEQITNEILISTGAISSGANVLVRQGQQNLIVQGQLGYGEVFYLAFDAAAINGWDSGLISLFEKLFLTAGTQPGWRNGFQNWENADNAAGAFISLGLPSIFLICSLLCVYVAVLGPLNFIVLQRLNKREWAWLTVPGLVVFFSLLTLVLGSQIRGGQARLNRIAIVQVHPNMETARVDGVIGIFSPSRSDYQVLLNNSLAAHPIPNSSGGGDWRIDLNGDQSVMPDVRVDAGGIERLAVQGQISAPDFANDLTLTMGEQGIELNGSIQNLSDVFLEDAVLFYPGGSFEIGDFPAGASQTISISIPRGGEATYAGLSSAGTNPFQPIYFSGDGTLAALNNGSTYYSDGESFLRYSLVNALMQTESSVSGRGNGMYLAGWSTEPILDVSLEQNYRSDDHALYLISINPEIDTEEGNISIFPVLFDWYVLEGQENAYGESRPYGMSLTGGSASLEFILGHQVPYNNIESLNFQITDFGVAWYEGLEISLWDFSENAWASIPIDDFGNHEIASPQRFVGPQTTIRLMLSDPQTIGYWLEATDFTLVVSP